MDARIGWTLSAVGLVVMFVGARIYVSQALEAGTETEVDRPPQTTQRPPAKPMPKRGVDPLASVKDATTMVMSIPEGDLEANLADAHAALAQLDGAKIEWTPELAKRSDAMWADTERLVMDMEGADTSIHAHVLATRVKLAESSGVPNEEAAKRLATLREGDPEAFAWE